MPRVAVVIPAYRVARHIEAVLRGIPGFVSVVVVVDDASPDETAIVVESCGDPRVHLVRRAENGGVGAAVHTGYCAALELGAEIVVKMDGDDQMDPSYMAQLVEPVILGEADYSKGNRFIHTSQLGRMPPVRRLGNMGLSFLLKAASGYWDVFDPTNGYTAISSSIVPLLDWDRVDNRWFFETSLLLELSAIRAVVQDVPMPARYGDEQSTLSERQALLRFPLPLLAGFFRRIWLQYFIRDFSPVALLGVAGLVLLAFGAAWGAAHWWESSVTGREASTGTVMLAVLPLILGAQLCLQALVLDIQNVPRAPLTHAIRLRRALTAACDAEVPRPSA